ncbi:MAG: hypothetical protein H7345_08405 [Rubritepida sp.]|nr:hypothetical protein [Rubritepida sp.]
MKHSPFAWSMMLGDLTLASWETIMHRTRMMADGSCTIGEYQRMGTEKLVAMQSAAIALATGQGHAAAMQPFLSKARANARRLRA